jgi:hypothetical protein
MPLEDQLKLKITSFLKYGGDGELNSTVRYDGAAKKWDYVGEPAPPFL